MSTSWLTSEDLIASVVRRAHIPINQSTFSNDDILAFANEEMMIGLVPSILKVHEEFFTYPFAIDMSPNQSYYEIPDRAMGQKVRAMFYQDQSQNLQEMARILPEDLAFYQNRSSINYPRAFFLENNFMVMVPTISDQPQGDLIVKIFLRPNQLVTSDQVAYVRAINFTTGDITIDNIPDGFTLTTNGQPTLYDFVEVNHGHRTKGINVTANSITTVNSTTSIINFNPPTPPNIILTGLLNGTNVVTDLSPVSSLSVNMQVSGNGIMPGTFISAILSPSSVVLSLPATITSASVLGFSLPPLANNIPANTNTIPVDLNVGDIVALATEVNIPQVPDELHSMLVQRVVCKCLEAQKDTEGLQNALRTLQEMELNLERLIDNRTEGQPQKVNNLRSALRAGKFRRRRSTY